MSKKDCNQEVEFATENLQPEQFEDEPLYEAEAYTTPQGDLGADVTVTKPVGFGAPVPIIAPRHTTVQLQPIVVPLAVIPYMSQDFDVIAGDGRQQYQQPYYGQAYGQPYGQNVENVQAQPAEFQAVEQAKKKVKKQRKAQPRVFSLINFLVAAVCFLPFILSNWFLSVGEVSGTKLSITEFDIIRVITNWVNDGFNYRPITNIVYIAVAVIAAVFIITTLIGIISGKYPRVFNCLLSLGVAGGLVAVLIKDLVKDQFVLENRIVLVVLVALALLNVVLTIAFSIALNRLDDKVERIEKEI